MPAVAQNADAFFDDSVLHDIHLEMNQQDWETLKANFLENTYYPANLRWRNTTIESIGIRSRGLGSRSGEKPGLRVDFDRYEKNQKFLGLKSVILDNVTQDYSLFKERISMSLFRQMGVSAPREAHARLLINGRFAGVYAIVEAVDKLFLQQNLGEDGGHLYEYGWTAPYRFEFLGDEGSSYVPSPFEPETEENDPKPENLVRFVRFFNTASDAEFETGISAFLDVGLFARYLATEHFVADVDGINGYEGMNNFYLYRFKGTDRWQFIPWDKDVTFINIDFSVMYNIQENVLTRRLMNVPEFRDAYVAALLRVAQIAGESGGWLEQEIDRISDQIRTAVYSDPFPKCLDSEASCSASYFEGAVSDLREFAQYRSSVIQNQLIDLGMMPPP